MTKAKWYFDFISPFAYLQFARFPQLPNNLEVTPVPAVLGQFCSIGANLGQPKFHPRGVLFIDFFNGTLIN